MTLDIVPLHPPDATLDALRVAMSAFPDEDTPVCLYIDRCRELGRDFEANLHELTLITRQWLRTLVSSFGVPAHLLTGAPPYRRTSLPARNRMPLLPNVRCPLRPSVAR